MLALITSGSFAILGLAMVLIAQLGSESQPQACNFLTLLGVAVFSIAMTEFVRRLVSRSGSIDKAKAASKMLQQDIRERLEFRFSGFGITPPPREKPVLSLSYRNLTERRFRLVELRVKVEDDYTALGVRINGKFPKGNGPWVLPSQDSDLVSILPQKMLNSGPISAVELVLREGIKALSQEDIEELQEQMRKNLK